jgi:hypothetical protein
MGSVGVLKDYCIPLSITITLLFLGVKLIKGVEIKIPKNFKIFFIFTIGLLLHLLLFGGVIIWFWLFLSAGLYWITFYNIKDSAKKYFIPFIIFLGLLMLALFMFSKLRGINFLSPDNLFLPLRADILHNHIGDLWAVILVITIYKSLTKFKTWHLPVVLIGITMLALSFSRSAVVSLIVGAMYIVYKLNLHLKKNIVALVVFVCSVLFIYFSFYKSTIFARPYFLEALHSLVNTPFGIGMAKFSEVSPETNVVHNIVLEVVSGIGVFSAIFIYWLYKVGKSIYENKNINIELTAIFIAIFVNFFFDSTYVIPGMLWIWFIALALI